MPRTFYGIVMAVEVWFVGRKRPRQRRGRRPQRDGVGEEDEQMGGEDDLHEATRRVEEEPEGEKEVTDRAVRTPNEDNEGGGRNATSGGADDDSASIAESCFMRRGPRRTGRCPAQRTSVIKDSDDESDEEFMRS
ncbi:hypothetical protein HK101_007801 [Irineochytrium annulatum]|nr:hypothetical protein HK101_007801 [Irineochytrium annulatum]